MLSYLLAVLAHLTHLILGIGSPQKFPPPLSPARERECFLLAAEGDEEARQELILHNLRLVAHIVRKYYASHKRQEDLISVGSIGLVKAVDSFNVQNGARFATYAAKCIQNEILMYFRSQKKTSHEVSIHETIDVDRDGNPLTYMDVIYTEDNTGEEIDRKLAASRAMTYLHTVLGERERQIIRMRYGLEGQPPLTQREVAQVLGISRSYVSRIEKSALEKLQAAFRNQQN